MALNKVNYINNSTVIGANNLNDIQNAILGATMYSDCSTEAATQTKSLTPKCPSQITYGDKITVLFINGNSHSEPYLKIDNLSTLPVIDSDVNWSEMTVVEFTRKSLNGSGWVVTGRSDLSNVATLTYTVVSTF